MLDMNFSYHNERKKDPLITDYIYTSTAILKNWLVVWEKSPTDHSPIGLAADFFKKQCIFVDCCHKLSNVPTPRVCNCTLKNEQKLIYLRS